MLNGVSMARRTWRTPPPAVMTSRNFFSLACAPSTTPASCANEVGTTPLSMQRSRCGRSGSDYLRYRTPPKNSAMQQRHLDMSDPEIVERLGGHGKAEAVVERHQMLLRPQHQRPGWVIAAT